MWIHTWCINNGILLGHKTEWNNAVCSSIDGPRDHHAKWSKPDRYHTTAYMWNLKKE